MEKTTLENTSVQELSPAILQAVAAAVREQTAPLYAALEALQAQQNTADSYWEKMAVVNGGVL